MTAEEITILARKHMGQNKNAIVCARESERFLVRRDDDKARFYGLRSLKHSLGVMSPIYQEAAAE